MSPSSDAAGGHGPAAVGCGAEGVGGQFVVRHTFIEYVADAESSLAYNVARGRAHSDPWTAPGGRDGIAATRFEDVVGPVDFDITGLSSDSDGEEYTASPAGSRGSRDQLKSPGGRSDDSSSAGGCEPSQLRISDSASSSSRPASQSGSQEAAEGEDMSVLLRENARLSMENQLLRENMRLATTPGSRQTAQPQAQPQASRQQQQGVNLHGPGAALQQQDASASPVDAPAGACLSAPSAQPGQAAQSQQSFVAAAAPGTWLYSVGGDADHHPMAMCYAMAPGWGFDENSGQGRADQLPGSAADASGHQVPADSQLSRRRRRDVLRPVATPFEEPPVAVEERTTVMLRNLPNNYNRDTLLAMLDSEGFSGLYDFVYLPMDFKTQACMGYAFVNLLSPFHATQFWEAFDGYSKWVLPSRKICGVTWSGPHQGREAHIERYRNSPVMHALVPEVFKPVLFDNGRRVPFPTATKQPRAPRARHYGARGGGACGLGGQAPGGAPSPPFSAGDAGVQHSGVGRSGHPPMACVGDGRHLQNQHHRTLAV